ncbi:MAG TPA: glycosyltransferase family 4 protein, partial [Hyphomonadaceae bacterium]|nr:glycosyltransferase family 4 protein [Hyphomonadaceae bacterium]
MLQQVIYPFRGAELGGSHVATFTLARAIKDQHGAECVVLCPEGTVIAKEAEKAGLRVAASGETPTGRNNLATDIAWRNRRKAVLERETRGRNSVVHCNDINTLRSWGLAARMAGLGVAYHHHALNRMWWPPHLVSLAYPDAVIAVSDATRQAVQRWRGDAIKELNTFELDPGYCRKTAREALRQANAWPQDAVIVGWIGNFWERKRPQFFLNVAAELKRLDPRYRFVMFGRDGDYSAAEMRQLAAKYGVAAETALPGFRQPVEANVACLDLLLAPAPREPFGRALVEAI